MRDILGTIKISRIHHWIKLRSKSVGVLQSTTTFLSASY